MDANDLIKNAGTKMLCHVSESAPFSEGFCNSSSGSAVSALQSKFREISQRQSTKGNGPPEFLQTKSEKEPLFLSIPEVKLSSSGADESSEVQNLPTSIYLKEIKWKKEGDAISSLYCGPGEGFRMQNQLTNRDGSTVLSMPTYFPTLGKASKGFCGIMCAQSKVAQPKTRVSNKETTRNVVNTREEKQNVGVQGPVDQNELHQKPSNVPEKEVISEKKKVQINKKTLAMLPEGLCQPSLIKGLPLPNKEAGMDKLIIGLEINIGSDLTLSPRHKQAKRLLERARLKTRFQTHNSDTDTQVTSTDLLELLPICNPSPSQIITIHKQKVPSPNHLLDVHSKQSQLHSNKEAEHHYPEELGLIDSSLCKWKTKAKSALKVSQDWKSLESNNGSVCTSMTNQEDTFLLNKLTKDEPKTCETCGSMLTSSYSRKPRQNAKGQINSVNCLISSQQLSHKFIKTKFSEGTMLTRWDRNVETARLSNAGKIAFGKLRRRSRKGESRVEASHRPYARGQDLLAQRRNSRTKFSLEDGGSHSKPVRGVTFAMDSFLPTATNSSKSYRDASGMQLPIKSALKSGSKSRPVEQHEVKNLPLNKEMERSSHYAVSLGPRYPSRVGTVVELVDGHSPNEDPTCATSLSPECRPIVQRAAILKTEDLRAKPLRREHCKDELQWDMHLGSSRRTMDREGGPKLSLRRFFSAMGLNSIGKMGKDNRSSSMEHLSLSSIRVSPSQTPKDHTQLQKTPSLQAIHTESPLAQLRKASSVQSLQSPKKKHERSTILGEIHLPLILGPRQGIENVDATQHLGPTGRIVQTFSDGSLLLELTRPVNTSFGFVISRRKGRSDSGIYVEQVLGSTTENIYTSLLGVGDEILEVNGEKVNGLSLDQITCLMTRESTATVRLLPHRWIQQQPTQPYKS